MSIRLDDRYAQNFAQPGELAAMAAEVQAAQEKLHSATGAGSDFLGWLTLPTDYDKEEFGRIQAAAKRIRENSDVLIVIGIGGSYLGARAVLEFIKSPHYNLLAKDTPQIYFTGNSISSTALSELLELCLTLGSCILTQAGMAADDAAARAMLEQTITDGSALKKLAEFVAAQDGDPAAIYDPSRLPMAPVQMEVPSPARGYVRHIAATDVGLVSMRLGGGRATKDSVIDHSVGIVLRKKVDEPVTAGESLATIHAADEAAARRAVAELAACYTITPDAPPAEPFIKAIIR